MSSDLEQSAAVLTVKILGALGPVLEQWILARLGEGTSPDLLEAEAIALFAAGDAIVDEAEDQKFGAP